VTKWLIFQCPVTNVFGTSLGRFTLLPLSLVSFFDTGEGSVELVVVVVVVDSLGDLLLPSCGGDSGEPRLVAAGLDKISCSK